MSTPTRYSAAIKASVLAKAFAPNPKSVVELAKEFNIPVGTIYTWKYNMLHNQNPKQGNNPQRPQDKSVEVKLQSVIDTANMTEAEQGAYCREHGIYADHLDAWKKQFLDGFVNANIKQQKADNQQITNENKQLKRDLHRKDKALAEVSALLILQKKADLLWGVNEDD
jgi:transposase